MAAEIVKPDRDSLADSGQHFEGNQMKRLADYEHPLVAETAARLTQGETTTRDKLKPLFLYVRDQIKFAFPEAGDLVTASETIRLGIGQCNTKATLLLALCKASAIPARIHFSLISKEIQKGFFTGIAYWLMPQQISHSWIEVDIEGQWRRIDTFINDRDLFESARTELKRRGWTTGFSIALTDGDESADLNLDSEAFQQMAAVTEDHGTWDDPSDYYSSGYYRNRLDPVRMWLYRQLIGRINRGVERLRQQNIGDVDSGASSKSVA